jgi:TIR domain
MADIFLSYNEKDRNAVGRLAVVLQKQGWSVWWDRRIPAGQTWRGVLERELQSMRCMVVLWSANSVRSEWVCEEAAEARQTGRLVPVAIDHTRPPAGFREVQAADLVDWDGSPDFVGLRQLIEDIERLIGKPQVLTAPPVGGDDAPTPPPARPTDPRPRPLPSPRSWQPWGLAAVVALLAVGAYVALWQPYVWDAKKQASKGAATTNGAALGLPVDTASPVPTGPVANGPVEVAQRAPDAKTVVEAPKSNRPPNPRCSALRERQVMGEAMSAEAQQFLRQECRP